MKIDTGFAESVVSQALRQGADQAEVYMKASRHLSIEVRKQAVDSFASSHSYGYSLRVIRDSRLGFSYATSNDEQHAVIKNALESAACTDSDTCLDFPDVLPRRTVDVFDPAVESIEEEYAIQNIMALEQAAFLEDRRITKTRKASGTFVSSALAVVNSKGVLEAYVSTSCAAQVMAVAEQGDDSQIGWDFQGSRFLKDMNFSEIGRNAARKAARLLGARKINGFKTNIILDSSVAADFLAVFSSSLSSESVQKGKSLLKGKRHEKIISPKVNITDSGILPGKLGSRPVDDEGVPTTEKMLVQGGVLHGFLYNTCTARKDKVVSTGNAVRGGISVLPSVGITNLFITPAAGIDTVAKDNLFSSLHSGLYVVDAMGVHTANPISGDFSVGVTGLWIEGGEVQFPVKEAVMSGNILDFLDTIETVSDDLKFYGNIGAPSLIIPGVDISA